MTYGPTLVGLAAIPFIIHPIDHSVDYVMDRTYRAYFDEVGPGGALNEQASQQDVKVKKDK